MPNQLVVPEEKHQQYLGDGVYVSYDGYQFWLRTERAIHNVHEIALEPQIVANLFRYLAELGVRPSN